ncbi:MAG: exodeoxyribonuclease VII large subunit, partial [Actinobacteria bacterium]|nr:exodeoxyribonuclease VII large subunit [Actinomycetota bacterium]
MTSTQADRDAPVLGVEQAMGLARQAVESIVPGTVWLVGEVSGLTKSRAGHTYFSLHPAGDTS